MLILSDTDIRKETALIQPFCEEHLRSASYVLSMSNTISWLLYPKD